MSIYRATLPHPPGINQSYASGRGRFYSTPRARAWKEEALLLLAAQGWRPLPRRAYRLAFSFTLHTTRHDLDSCIKATLDVCCQALGVDDRHVEQIYGYKHRVKASDQQIEVEIAIHQRATAPARPEARKKLQA